MTRPLIVRADTIDLQNHEAPSAKDHDRQHLHPTESTAPHQASTLRDVAHETAEEQSRSPHLSWSSGFLIEEPRQPSDDEDDDIASGVRGRMAHQDQEDHLAIAQNGGVSSSDEGEDDGDLDDDMMDRISSSPSIEDEDIDFDFVYALHTFVATVEGQANATKGDTMVLLDDSNSYWWLVRVVKDSSIGYLPAEHIETPTERLARWNKHRNVDLSAAMLGDNPQKQKSTLKSIKRRWKTVTFTEPTYVDYSDIDYSTDEEDIEELFGDTASGQLQDGDRDEEEDRQQQQKQQDKDPKAKQLHEEEQRLQEEQASSDEELLDDRAKVEPLKTQPTKTEVKEEVKELKTESQKDEDDDEVETRDSTELLGGGVGMVGRTRNGKIRNTDSFFKDETVETKKITLTPNLLRDDGAARPSTDSIVAKDSKTRPSLETKMDKEFVSDKDSKKNKKDKEKKEKDKKPSAIRSFFSRKDKKRTSEDDEESVGKRSMDVMSEPRESEDPMADDQEKPHRTPSKLQKQQPRTEPAATRKNSTGSTQQKKSPEISNNPFSESRTNNVSNVPPSTMRIVDPETKETREVPSHQQSTRDVAQREEKPASANNMALRTAGSTSAATQNLSQARSRMDLEDSDSSDAAEALLAETPPSQAPASALAAVDREKEGGLRPHVPGAFPDSHQSPAETPTHRGLSPDAPKDRLSESPVEVSPVSRGDQSYPPGLVADAAPSPSPETSPSPDFVGADEGIKGEDDDAQQQPAWNDTKLRAFFDEGKHVRDLLAVVYDTSDVEPADSNAGSLFREQNAKLAEITTQLDNMLGDWLARKQRLRGTL